MCDVLSPSVLDAMQETAHSIFLSKMQDENIKIVYSGFGFVSLLIFLALCNVYQPIAAIAALTLTTIFMSLIWLLLIGLLFGIICFIIAIILGALS